MKVYLPKLKPLGLETGSWWGTSDTQCSRYSQISPVLSEKVLKEVTRETCAKALWPRRGEHSSRSEKGCRPWKDREVTADAEYRHARSHQGSVILGIPVRADDSQEPSGPCTTTKAWTPHAIAPGTLPRHKGGEENP